MNENNTCPLCGKEKEEDSSFCNSCRERVENEFPTFFDNEENNEIASEDIVLAIDDGNQEEHINPIISTKKSYSRKKILLTILVCSLLSCIGGVIFYHNQQQEIKKKNEYDLWNKSIDINTPISYSNYLQKYPKGKFKDDAESRIRSLRDNETKAWNKIIKSSNILVFSSFIEDHPNSPYKSFARTKIDSLAWIAAKKDNSKDAYKAYIDNVDLDVYDGKYLIMAEESYNYLIQLKTVEGENLEKIYNSLNEVATLLSTSQYTKAKKLFAGNKFQLNGNSISWEDFLMSIRENLRKDKVKKSIYTIEKKSLTAIEDNKGIYFIKLLVNRKTTYINRKKKPIADSIKLDIELGTNMKLKAIKINKEHLLKD